MQDRPGYFRTFFQAVGAILHRHWKRALQIREKLALSEEAFHLLLAGGVGFMGGFINLVFFRATEFIQVLLVGYPGRNIVEAAEHMEAPMRILTPTMGALAAGLVLFWGLRLVGSKGSSNLLEVVVAGDGRLSLRSGLVRSLSSILSIGTGASIGREGAIAQLAATAASKWGQMAHWQPYRLRLLVACGAASGISAAYSAPIAGAVFAAQIVLGNFSMNMFAPLLFASVIATTVSRGFFGVQPWYEAPSFDFTSLTQLPWFLLLGFLSGVLGALFLKLLARSESIFKEVPTIYLRMTFGGLLVGMIAVIYPDVWGNGYVVTNKLLLEHQEYQFVLGIFIAKLAATVLTVGSGTVGGVFTPTLFLGASLGSLMGMTLQRFEAGPDYLPIGAFALVGMGSVLSATTRSPLLAIIMLLEISLNYSLMPALMLSCAVSTLVARRLHPNSIYTEPLKLRSLEVESYRLGSAGEQTVGDLMRAPVEPVRDNSTLPEIADRFLKSANNFLPVVDEGRRLIGIVSLHDLKEYLTAGRELNAIIAFDVMRPVPICLTPNQKLLDVVPLILASEQKNIPVINTQAEKRLVGSLLRAEALGLLSEMIASTNAASEESGPSATKEKSGLPPKSQGPKL